MKTFLNIIWHIPFFGFLFALSYALVGLLFCITIVGLPIGLGLLQFSKFLLWPHGNKMVNSADIHELKQTEQNGLWKIFALVVRILYFPFGLFAAIGCIITIVAEFVSIIGIPSGLVWAKSLGTIFNPVNKVCVPEYVALEIEKKKQEKYLRNKGMTNSSTIANADAVAAINSISRPTPPPPPVLPPQPAVSPASSAPIAQIVSSVAANANAEEKVVISLPESEEDITQPEDVVTVENSTLSLQTEETEIETTSFGYVEIEKNEEVVYGGVSEDSETETEVAPVIVVEEFEAVTTIVVEENATDNKEAAAVEETKKEVVDESPIIEDNGKEEKPIEIAKEERPSYGGAKYTTSPPYSKEEIKEEAKAPAVDPYSTEGAKKKSNILWFILAGVVLVGAVLFIALSGKTDKEDDPTEVVTDAEEVITTSEGEEPLVKQEDIVLDEATVIEDEPEIIEPVEVPAVKEKGAVKEAIKEPASVKEPVKTAAASPQPEKTEPVKAEPAAHPAYGTKNYPSGTVYTGDFNSAGLRHGKGSYSWPSGDKYVGDWINDNATGNGIYYSNEGWRYEGQFMNLKFHGKGVYYFANGKSRKGTWINGQMQK